MRTKLVNAYEYRGATIRGKRIVCVCKNFEFITEELQEREIRLALDDAICVVDVPYGVEKFK